MERIKDTLTKVLEDIQFKKSIGKENGPQIVLKKILTKRELKHIKFNYFRKGVLDISVDSSSWLYNLSLKKDSLIAKFGESVTGVKDIRFRLGEIK